MTVHLPSLRDVTFAEVYEPSYPSPVWRVTAAYETPGPAFTCAVRIKSRDVLPSERSAVRTRLYRQAFNDLNAQVQAHLDVTLPVPNH